HVGDAGDDRADRDGGRGRGVPRVVERVAPALRRRSAGSMRPFISALFVLLIAVATTACGENPAPPAAKPTETPVAKPPAPVLDAAQARVIEQTRAELVQDSDFKDVAFQSALVEPFVVFQEVNEQD